ncbi:hypothetical protein ATCC90586_005332 [Pythium insidiosum]|nr:hypothetical protein ATCC90586_005332 [Pythium insidiosum]
MDWSSVYDNHGEEDGRWEDHGETRSSRFAHRLIRERKQSVTRSLSSAGSFLLSTPAADIEGDQESAQYSPVVAYAFTVNYILGVGSLGIPFAFFRAGLVMSNAMIVIVTMVSYWTVMWVSETVARARQAPLLRSILDEKTALVNSNSAAFDDFPEVTWLCDRFLGRVGSRLYQISLLGLMYGGLLGYSQVFVNSFLSQVTHIGGLTLSSVHGALLFGVIVVPLSCADLTEQIVVQLAMSVVRFAALMIMIVSASYAIFADPYDTGEPSTAPLTNVAPYISDYSLVDFSGFGVMFSTAVFSQLFQHSVPGLLAPLGPKNQSKAHSIFGSTLLTTMLFYVALGSVCSLYFGPKVASSVNLNWSHFTWGISEIAEEIPWWAKTMSTIVVIFPALDTLSVYPLISVTLGDNMAAVAPEHWVHRIGGRSFWKMVCRFAACLPPLIVSVFVSDLSLTLQFSGIAGIYVAFFAPALLHLSASTEIPSPTVYSGRFSGRGYAYAVLVFGVFAFSVLVIQLVQQILN